MKQKLIKIVEELGYPIFLQGTLQKEEEYPCSFFTFWNFQGDESYYNNESKKCVWGFWLYFYSNDPQLVETEMLKAKKLLKENNFIIAGRATDTQSDEVTHTGTMLEIYYIENYKEE